MGCCQSSGPPPYTPLAEETKQPLEEPSVLLSELRKISSEAQVAHEIKQFDEIVACCHKYAKLGHTAFCYHPTVSTSILERVKKEGITHQVIWEGRHHKHRFSWSNM